MDIIWRFVSATTSLLLVLVFQFLEAKPKKPSLASFFVLLPFVVFMLFGQQNSRVFSKCFLSNISFCILKRFVFPAVTHVLGKELLEEKPSEVQTVYILGSAAL